MTNKELKRIVDKIIEREPTNLTELAAKAEVDRSNLSTQIHAEEMKEMSKHTVNKIRAAYPKYFVQETTVTNTSEDMPFGGLQRTLRDYVEKIERDNEFYQRILESSLVDISETVKKLLSLPALPTHGEGTSGDQGQKKFGGMSHTAAKKVDVRLTKPRRK